MHLSFCKLLFIYLLFYLNEILKCHRYVRDATYRLRYLKRELLINEFNNLSQNPSEKINGNNLYCNYYVKNWPNLINDVPRYTIPCPEVNDKCVTITGTNDGETSLWEGCFSTSKILFNYLNTSCNENNCIKVNDKIQNRNGISCCCASKMCNHDSFKSSGNVSLMNLLVYFVFCNFVFIIFLI
ncbi:Hypothetical protein SRAE_1000060000 [Strongyloides ratti]|uniref:Caenorhabditis elegans ly-6-related family-containing protein n=1 Tax=Strongyloides ratti TaxID=34506 RepID=A0A090L2K2_STRRB|nr:Hypothetical protein SRAE_1000060000 [Strongyloides ratti]CEF62327.1 Hypothetical protein SRAE_1000060000 [Strongyloides ratti]